MDTDAVFGVVPLAQSIEEYLDWLALDEGRSPNTVRAHRADLNWFRGCVRRQVRKRVLLAT